MDELKLHLRTRWMKSIVTKIISKAVFNKTGCNVDILLNKIEMETIDGKVYFHADLNAECDSEEFVKILKSIGLD